MKHMMNENSPALAAVGHGGRSRPRGWSIQLLAPLVALSILTACRPNSRSPAPDDHAVDLPSTLEDATVMLAASDSRAATIWKKAVNPIDWQLPDDHGAHADYQIEWWYYTGNLRTDDGRPFGFQLTFFRTGLDRLGESPSRWAARDLYTAHFAVSDIRNKDFHGFERTNRAGIGWAGATVCGSQQPVRVWNAGWKLIIDGDEHRLVAEQEGFAIDLTLCAEKPPTFHHGDGLSQKGPSEGNASHYYSYTRMKSHGTVTAAGEELAVSGLSWMDHEFSSSFLEPGQAGWDWFSIQLNDGSDLMIYQIRDEDGKPGQWSSGTWVPEKGEPVYLTREDFRLTSSRQWNSPATGGDYPISWQVEVPQLELKLAVEAAYGNQEMNTLSSTGIIYWEGSIDVTGSRINQAVTGSGYLEMTGYSGKDLGRRFKNSE